MLPALRVTFSKLKKYTAQQGGYDLEQLNDNVTLSFVPSFPEAMEKGFENSPPPRVIMRGRIRGENVEFDTVEVEEENNVRKKDLDVAQLTYSDWLYFIEENY